MIGILAALEAVRPLVISPGFVEDEIDIAIHNRCAAHWVPAPEVPAEQWLRENLKIAGNQSAGGGGMPLDLRRNPQARVVAEFMDDPFAEELNIKKCSAGGISTTIIGLCVRRLRRDPVNILYLIGNEKQAREMSDIYWRPFLRQVFGGVADAKHQSTLHFKINGVEIILGSPTEEMLRNKQFGLVVEDESDTMEDVLKGGAQNLDVAERERTKNFKGSKIIRLCCPLYEWDPAVDQKVKQPLTRISRHYQAGDQREFRVPCPACRMENAVQLSHLVCPPYCMDLTGAWDLDRVREETVWQCPACQHAVPDTMAAKHAFLGEGRHVPTVKAPSGRIWSAQVTDLAVLFGKAASWGFVKASVIEAEKKGSAALAGVMRSHMGVAQKREEENLSRSVAMLLRHCSHYDRGACPLIPYVVILAADVQDDATYFPWTLQAFNKRGDLFLLDWGEAQDTDELETIRKRPVPVRAARASIPAHLLDKFPDGNVPDIYVSHAVIDSGHRAKGEEVDPTATTVYKFCHQAGMMRVVSGGVVEYPYRWIPMKGRGESQLEVLIKTSRAILNDRVELPLILFKDPAFKSEIYHYQLAYDPTPGAEETKVQTAARQLPRIVLPRYVDDQILEDGVIGWRQLLEDLQAERYGTTISRRRNGGGDVEVRRWYVPKGMHNNLSDCIKMARVRFATLGPPV